MKDTLFISLKSVEDFAERTQLVNDCGVASVAT